jgi:orotate phosphoribosyltransferase|tara:strand:- start:373 stop:858 length:486 start_codon:yes stop_codon:yes gene_type:complete
MSDELLLKLRELIVEPPISGGNLYLNVKRAYEFPEIMDEIADRIYESFEDDVNCVVGYCSGGNPLAEKIGQRNPRLKVAYIEKVEIDDKIRRVIKGHIPSFRDNVAVVDDICIRGRNIRRAKSLLGDTGTNISGFYFVVKRMEEFFGSERVRNLYRYRDFT